MPTTKKITDSLVHKLVFKKLWTYPMLSKAIAKSLDNRVADGFSKGMIYKPQLELGNPIMKLVGTYESELTHVFESFDQQPPRVILNIGTAEGYYAVGSLLRWKDTIVHGWEMAETPRTSLQWHAKENGVEERLHVHGACDEEKLFAALQDSKVDLIVMDVEEYEMVLCSERTIEKGKNASWIIECHTPQILETLKGRFATTHEVEVIQNREKSFKEVNVKLPWYCTLLPQDQWRIVQEGRPFDTPWIIARPKNDSAL